MKWSGSEEEMKWKWGGSECQRVLNAASMRRGGTGGEWGEGGPPLAAH